MSEKGAPISLISSFLVTEDELFLVTDARECNVKIYDKKGTFLRSFGRHGQGPGEFQGVSFCDYQKPSFIVFDPPRMTICVYKRIGYADFQKTHDLSQISSRSRTCYGIKLYGNGVLFVGPMETANGEPYAMAWRSIQNGKVIYLLPTAVKYGLKPHNKNFLGKYMKISADLGIPDISFVHVLNDRAYFAWMGELRIVEFDLKTKKWTTFGKETKNYSRPHAQRRRSFSSSSYSWAEQKKKFSFITGVFADRDFIGILYVNFNKQVSAWRAYLQLYDHHGRFMEEMFLPEAYDEFYWLRNYYNKENHSLYILVNRIDEKGIDIRSEMLKYRIQK